jgi:hypothetical protein
MVQQSFMCVIIIKLNLLIRSDSLLYKGVIHFLINASNQDVMVNFLKRLDSDTLNHLFELLASTTNEVEQRWINAYNMIDHQIC